MLSPIAVTLLIVYSVVLVASYFVVRRGWIRAYPTFVVSFVVNAMVLFSFSLARGNSLFQALIVGLAMATIFSGLSVTIGRLFRDTAPVGNKTAPAPASRVIVETPQARHLSA